MIYPCASVISVFHFRPVDIAEGWWTPYYPWNIFFLCCRCVPSLRRGHKSKKETRISQTWHGSVFHGSFFDNIWVSDSWIWLWIYWDLRVLTHSLSWRYRYCYSAYRQQPPPSLPRRGGTDSLECLTICKISIFGVTCNSQSLTKQSNCPSPSGEVRWGLKWLTEFNSRVTCISPSGENEWGLMFIGWIDLLKSLTKQSNLFLPFGKGRMGLEDRWGLIWLTVISCRVTCPFPLGRLGWVIIRGGTDSLGSSQKQGQAGFCLSPNGVWLIGDKWATSVQQTCPSGVTGLPMLGNVLAPCGQAPCPKMVQKYNM